MWNFIKTMEGRTQKVFFWCLFLSETCWEVNGRTSCNIGHRLEVRRMILGTLSHFPEQISENIQEQNVSTYSFIIFIMCVISDSTSALCSYWENNLLTILLTLRLYSWSFYTFLSKVPGESANARLAVHLTGQLFLYYVGSLLY